MLFLKTFGGLSVDIDGAPGTGAGQQRKTLALLALLAAAGRRGVSRDKLTAYLWPESDTEHARNLLKQACFALRRDLHAPDLFLGAVELRLNPDVISTDVETLEDALSRGDATRAVAIYAGPFLDGFYLAGAAEFERWVETTRAAIKARVGDALEGLAATIVDPSAAVKVWRQLVVLDPLAARAALGLLRALISAGERSAALEFGRVHENLVRQELGVSPDPSVSELLRRLRSQGELGDEPSTSSAVVRMSAAPPAPAPPPRLKWRLAVGAGVLAVFVTVVLATTRPRALGSDAGLLAVAPFEVADPQLALLHEGLVDMVSRKLDGALRLRAVPASVVIGHWEGRADRVGALELAHRTGAGLVLFGNVARVGPDSVRLSATVLDAGNDRIVAEIQRTGLVDRIDGVTDALSLDVIRRLAPAGSWVSTRLATPATTSLAALKAFLEGEDFLRRYWLDSAVASYERALALDTTFGVALRQRGLARGWNLESGPDRYAGRIAAFSAGVHPRDSLMLAYSERPPSLFEPTFDARVRRQERILIEMLTRYPDDHEAWHEAGEVLFHYGFFWADSTARRARRAFDRAIARDSGYALAYIHPVEMALTDNDPSAALQYVDGYLAIPSVNREGAGMQLLALLLHGERDSRAFERGLDGASLTSLRRLANAIRFWPDADETQVLVARRLLEKARVSVVTNPVDTEFELRPFRSLLAQALIHRGRLREARDAVGNRFVMPEFMVLAELGVIPRDSVESAIDNGIYGTPERSVHAFFPSIVEGACYRTMDAALWWAARRDMAKLRRLVQRQESIGRTAENQEAAPHARAVLQFARVALAIARGDTATALHGLFPDSTCPGAPQRRTIQFRLLAASGRDEKAEWVWERLYDRGVPLILERARLAERLRDRPTAIRDYGYVVQAWLHADPELQPVVAEARAALRRLGDIQ